LKVFRWLLWAGLAIGLISIGAAIGGALNVTWKGEFKITPVEFVTTILAALSVLLALLTIFLGVFAFIGWRSINDGVRDHSLTYLSGELKEGRPMFNLIRNAVLNAVYEGVQRVDEEEQFDDDNNGDEVGEQS
jgi:amino acid transporter